MAAQILDEQPIEDNLDSLPTDEQEMSSEELTADLGAQQTTDDPSSPHVEEDDIPDKYRGKSIKEIVSMHQEAEKLIGKQGSEVGELRRTFDEYIKTQLQSSQTTAKEETEEEVDFFEDPDRAVKKAIDTHPEIVQARQAAEEYKRATSISQLKEKHPDMAQILQNPKFVDWAKGTTYRNNLFERADKEYDFGAADELVSEFKDRNAAAQQTVQAEKGARQQAVRQASTGSASGTNTGGSKKVYRRADIIKLMKNDPNRYDALSDEILKAYAEGRVR